MSKVVVLDASVLVKLYLNEDGSRRAVNEVKKAEALRAPDLLWSEVGNILWKYVRRDDLDADAAKAILHDMLRMPIVVTPSADLVADALDIATEYDRTVYDSLYLALAIKNKAVMLTADQRLVNSLGGLPLGKFVRAL